MDKPNPSRLGANLLLAGADRNFICQAVRYLDSALAESEVAAFQKQLECEPIKRKQFVRLAIIRSAIIEQLAGAGRQSSPLSAPGQKRRFPDPSTIEIKFEDMNDAMILPALRPEMDIPPAPDALKNDAPAGMFCPADQVRPISHWGSKPYRWFIGAVAVALLLLVAIGFFYPLLNHPIPPAKITAAVGAIWQGSQAIKVGSPVPRGSIVLSHGTIGLRITGGTMVTVQAPAKFRIVSPRNIYLAWGKLAAQVPHSVKGFTVYTRDGRIEDLGTAFGVLATASHPTYVVVFRGRVRAFAGAAGASASKLAAAGQVVAANHAVRISQATATITAAPAYPLAFVRPAELAAETEGSANAGYRRWQAFSNLLRKDTSLRAYYTFGKASRDAGQLLNCGDATRGRFNGRLGYGSAGNSRPTWGTGRWPGKGALIFDASRRTAVRLHVGPHFLPTRALTVAVWLKCTAPWQSGHIINDVLPQINRFDLVWLGTKPPEFTPRSIYFDWGGGAVISPPCLPATPRWTFIAITVARGKPADFYVNGRLIAAMVCKAPPPAHAMNLLIGKPAPVVNQSEAFDGPIDELAILARRLSPSEIAQMYEAGRPN